MRYSPRASIAAVSCALMLAGCAARALNVQPASLSMLQAVESKERLIYGRNQPANATPTVTIGGASAL